MSDEILKFVPHRKKMLFIDEVLDTTKENFTVRVDLKESFPVMASDGVPAYCAIEFMAQSICAYNTYNFTTDQDVKIGFMIAVRNFKSQLDYFPVGSCLDVRVDPVLIVDQTGSFTAEVLLEGAVVANARITAHVPTEEELKKLVE